MNKKINTNTLKSHLIKYISLLNNDDKDNYKNLDLKELSCLYKKSIELYDKVNN